MLFYHYFQSHPRMIVKWLIFNNSLYLRHVMVLFYQNPIHYILYVPHYISFILLSFMGTLITYFAFLFIASAAILCANVPGRIVLTKGNHESQDKSDFEYFYCD